MMDELSHQLQLNISIMSCFNLHIKTIVLLIYKILAAGKKSV